jgi:MFS family permease
MRALPTLALFVVSLGYGVVVPLLPQLSGGAAATSAGLVSVVYAAYAAAKILCQAPGGALVDSRGALNVLKDALALFTVSLAGFLWNGGVAWFTVVRAVEGAATGLVYPAVFALIAASGGTGKQIGLAVGIGTSGLLLGPVLGGFVGSSEPRAAVAVALLFAAVITAWSLTVKSPVRPEPAPGRTIAAELSRMTALLKDPAFVGLGLPIAFNKLTFSAFQGLIPLYGAKELGLGTRGITGLFALTGILFGAFQAVGGVLADTFVPRRVVLACTLPLLASLGAMAVSQDPWVFTAAWGAYVAFSSIIFTCTLKNAAKAFGTEDTYGGVFGVLGTATDLMTVVGPLLFLGIYGASGTAVFPAMAAIGIPFALGFVVLGARKGTALKR